MLVTVTSHLTFTWSVTTHTAKFWLEPVRLQHSGGFGRNEINRLHKLVTEQQEHLLRAGMSTLAIEVRWASATNVEVNDESVGG